MTPKSFKRYSKSHKIKNVITNDYSEIVISYDNDKQIKIGNGIEGLIFSPSWVRKGSTRIFFNRLDKMIPNYIDSLKEKYSSRNFKKFIYGFK